MCSVVVILVHMMIRFKFLFVEDTGFKSRWDLRYGAQ